MRPKWKNIIHRSHLIFDKKRIRKYGIHYKDILNHYALRKW